MSLPIFLSAVITAANLADSGAAVIYARNSGVVVAPEQAAQLTLLASHGPISSDPFRLTHAELLLAKERRRVLEEARDANVAARHAARQAEDSAASMNAEVVDAGLMLTFEDRSFASDAQLSAATRRRLDALVGFLQAHPESAIKFRVSPGYVSAADSQTHAARRAALKRYLTGAGIDADRLVSTRIELDVASVDPTAVQLVIEDSNIPN